MKLDFSCPIGIATITTNGSGQRWRTGYYGPTANPNVCFVNTPAARQAKRLEQWPYALFHPSQLRVTEDELALFRQEFSEFMHGRSTTASMITRGRESNRVAGEQFVEQWRNVGVESVVVGGTPVAAFKFRLNLTYSGTTHQTWREFWFDPKRHIFLKAKSSLEYGPEATWEVSEILDCPLCRPGASPPVAP